MRIFVSYKCNSHDDELLAASIAEAFRVSHTVFRCHDIGIGENLSLRIDQELETASCLICLLSTESLASEGVLEEINTAVMLEKSCGRPRVLPVWLGRPSPEALPYSIRSILRDRWFAVWEGREYTNNLIDRLRAEMKRIGLKTMAEHPFVDRDDVLERLTRWLNGTKGLLSLGVPPGRGKTSVANKLRSNLEENPGSWRTLSVDCAESPGMTPDALLDAVAAKLRQRLDEEHVPHRLALDEYQKCSYEDRRELLKTLVARDRTLLILDNFHLIKDKTVHEALRNFTRSVAELRVLLLSREKTEVIDDPYRPGEEEPLVPLPENWAHTYLKSHGYNCTETDASRIHERCGGEPLLMNAFMIMGRDRTVDEILALPLSTWGEGGEAFIKESLSSLGPEVVQAGRAASIFRYHAERAQLYAVSDRPKCIDDLIDHYLLEPDEQYRWALHPVLREIWSSELGADAAELHWRAADWLEAKGTVENLQRAFDHWCAVPEFSRAFLCADRLWTLSDGQWKRSGEALKLAERLQDESQQSIWNHHYGKLLENERDFESAERYYRTSLALAESAGAEIPGAESRHDLGRLVARVYGNFAEAEELLGESHRVYERHNNDEQLCVLKTLADHVYCAQGDQAWQLSRYDDAEKHYQTAHDFAARLPVEKSGDLLFRSLRDLRRTQAKIREVAGELESAELLYLEAVAAADSAGEADVRETIEKELVSVRLRWSEDAAERGELTTAKQFAIAALESATSIGAPAASLEFAATAQLAKVSWRLDEIEVARGHLFSALDSAGGADGDRIRLTSEVGPRLGAEGKWYLARSFRGRAPTLDAARIDAEKLYRDAAELFGSCDCRDEEQQVKDEWAAFQEQFKPKRSTREQIPA